MHIQFDAAQNPINYICILAHLKPSPNTHHKQTSTHNQYSNDLLSSLLHDGGQHKFGRFIIHNDVAVIDVRRCRILLVVLVRTGRRIGRRLIRHNAWPAFAAAVQRRLGQPSCLGDIFDYAAAARHQFGQMRFPGGSLLFRSRTKCLMDKWNVRVGAGLETIFRLYRHI